MNTFVSFEPCTLPLRQLQVAAHELVGSLGKREYAVQVCADCFISWCAQRLHVAVALAEGTYLLYQAGGKHGFDTLLYPAAKDIACGSQSQYDRAGPHLCGTFCRWAVL